MTGLAKINLLNGANSTKNIIAAQRGAVNTGIITFAQRTDRMLFYAHPKGNISNLSFIWLNWSYDLGSFQETLPGNSTTITASIEYPAGVFLQITFNNGSTSALMTDGGILQSDIMNIPIPAGTGFWVRTCNTTNGANKMTCATRPAACSGLGLAEGFVSGSDATLSGTITNSAGVNVAGPSAVIGNVGALHAKAYIIAGDSICYGQGDVSNVGSKGGSGYLERTLSNTGSYINISCPGQSVSNVVVSNTKLKAFIAALNGKYTELVCEYGINDIRLTSNMATIQSNLQAYWALYNGKISQCSISPHTTSTDGWITTVNQSDFVGGFWSAARLNTLNAWIRGYPTGMNNLVEAANAYMSAVDSDLWLAQNPGLTLDGAHATSAGYALFAANTSIQSCLY